MEIRIFGNNQKDFCERKTWRYLNLHIWMDFVWIYRKRLVWYCARQVFCVRNEVRNNVALNQFSLREIGWILYNTKCTFCQIWAQTSCVKWILPFGSSYRNKIKKCLKLINETNPTYDKWPLGNYMHLKALFYTLI